MAWYGAQYALMRRSTPRGGAHDAGNLGDMGGKECRPMPAKRATYAVSLGDGTGGV
jgi:hypothetical protein